MDEALTVAQRVKRAHSMKLKAPQMAKKRAKSMKKMANSAQLQKRARVHAIKLIVKKILKDRSKSDLGYAERSKLEKKVNQKKSVINKIAKKLLPKLKAKEKERLKKLKEK